MLRADPADGRAGLPPELPGHVPGVREQRAVLGLGGSGRADDAAARPRVAVRVHFCGDERSSHGGWELQFREGRVELPSDEQEAPIAPNIILRNIVPRRDAGVLPYPRCYLRRDLLEPNNVSVLLREECEQ